MSWREEALQLFLPRTDSLLALVIATVQVSGCLGRWRQVPERQRNPRRLSDKARLLCKIQRLLPGAFSRLRSARRSNLHRPYSICTDLDSHSPLLRIPGSEFRVQVPVCASIWSCGPVGVLGFSASSVLSFLKNHHMLQLVGRPQWLTVKNRSKTYVEKVSRSCHLAHDATWHMVPRGARDSSSARYMQIVGALKAQGSQVLLSTKVTRVTSTDSGEKNREQLIATVVCRWTG